MKPTATFVTECNDVLNGHRFQPVTPESIIDIHDRLVAVTRRHGYDHRPQVVTIVGTVGILMADPLGLSSFVVK